MGDANPIRTLGDYSKPIQEGYKNIIELPIRNNVVPLRSDTIRLVQNGCSFHGLRSEDPNQHLKDFLKLMDSLDLDGENKERNFAAGFCIEMLAADSLFFRVCPETLKIIWRLKKINFIVAACFGMLQQVVDIKVHSKQEKVNSSLYNYSIDLHLCWSLFLVSAGTVLFLLVALYVPTEGVNHDKCCFKFLLGIEYVRIHHNMEGSYYSFPCTILSTGKDCKTLQRYLDVPTTSKRIYLKSMDSFQGLTPKSPSSWHRPLAPKDPALHNNESWNDPRDFAKPVKAIYLPQDVLSTSDRCLIELKNQVQRLMEAHIALMQPTQVNKITSSCEICNGPHDTQYYMENPEQAFVEYASSRTNEARGALPSDMVKNPKLNVNSTSLVLSTRSYPTIDPQCLSRPFTSINAVKICSKEASHSQASQPQAGMILKVLDHTPIYRAMLDKYVESLKLGKNGSAFVQGEVPAKMEDPKLFTLPCRLGNSKPLDTLADLGSEWAIARDAEINPFKDVLIFRRMVEFLGAIPINLKRNMWESEDLIQNLINRNKPPKNRDGAWHAMIRLIDPDGEEFTKTLQSIPTSRNLSKRESPREIINLDHFYDT
ncbi:hypothetical protein Tco_0226235 [Tanacetum coccineum]